MLSRDKAPWLTFSELSAAIAVTLIVVAFSSPAAPAGLRPLTAFCFKTLGEIEVCNCASKRLANQISASSMQQYENLIALALAQTNVPRAQAWKAALDREAISSGVSLAQVKLATEASGREHHRAIQKCQALP